MCCCLYVTATCFEALGSCGRATPRVLWPAVIPGWPSMLAKRMSELRVGYISIQADMEWSWPWSWSSSRNFWENQNKFQDKNWYLMFKLIDFILFWLHNEKPGQFSYMWQLLHICVSSLSPGKPLCFCVVASSPWVESSVSPPPPLSPEHGCVPQNKSGRPPCPYLSTDDITIKKTDTPTPDTVRFTLCLL